MASKNVTDTKARPFMKWAGGKTQLLPVIDSFLPESFREERAVTYIEPFVGGGAMLFFMLQKYPNIKRAVINDINPHLINVYSVIRDNPLLLVECLREVQTAFRSTAGYEEQKKFYLDTRERFNRGSLTAVEEAACMMFMNRTCFNGLYRENSRGEFNVPFGRYRNPTICDEALIIADSRLLESVEIVRDDFERVREFADGYTLIYFDPPYRPLGGTSKFNSYVRTGFDDGEQLRLRDFYAEMSQAGCHAILSNSDSRVGNPDDDFFDRLYGNYIVERVYARRSINSNPSKRGQLSELLIRNYKACQG